MHIRSAMRAFLFLCSITAQGQAPSLPVQPYTAHFRITRTTSMPGGATTTLVSTETMARDRHGQTYQATRSSHQTEGGERWTTQFFVRDASDHISLLWDSEKPQAIREIVPGQGKSSGCWADASGRHGLSYPQAKDWYELPASSTAPPREAIRTMNDLHGKQCKVKVVTENLGAEEIAGQHVVGIKMTFVPMERGAESLNITSEIWRSAQLSLKMRERSTGPLLGTKKKELVDLKLDDADPALFEPPADYTIEDIPLHQIPCN